MAILIVMILFIARIADVVCGMKMQLLLEIMEIISVLNVRVKSLELVKIAAIYIILMIDIP